MRALLVGPPLARSRLRAQLNGAAVDIVGEFPSMAAANASAVAADAVMVARDNRDRDEDPVEPLTAREVEVLELLAEGLPNKAIAERLRISDQTVKFHLASISGKLGAVNRTDAVRRAVRRGLIAL